MNNSNSLAYEERVLAFIDVLGFAKLVEVSENDALARTRVQQIVEVDRLFERFMKLMFPLVDAAFFSDSFVLSAPVENTIYLIREAGYLCRHLLMSGFVSRGAIVAGSLHHKDRTIVGPAFLKAYRLERDVAIYPRVIIDCSALEYWNEELTEGSPHRHLASLTKIGPDGQAFLDIFDAQWGVFLPWTDLEDSKVQVPAEQIEFLNAARERIEAALTIHADDARVRMKFEWLASELEGHLIRRN